MDDQLIQIIERTSGPSKEDCENFASLIDDVHFHDEVFIRCAEIIRRDFPANQEAIRLADDAQFCGDLVTGVERNFCLALASQLFERLETIVSEFVFLAEERTRGNKRFANTFRFARCSRYEFLRMKFKRSRRRWGVRRCKTIFFRLLVCIVKDLNNLPGWKALNEGYRHRFMKENDVFAVSGTTPKTFLSYCFADHCYSLFLFDYFLERGGLLYVDALLGYKVEGQEIQPYLSKRLKQCDQFLFLRSRNSAPEEQPRPWCKWEAEQALEAGVPAFLVDVIGVKAPEDQWMQSYHHFRDVARGEIEAASVAK